MTEPEMHVTLICDEEPHAAELFAIGDRPLDVVRAVRRLTGLSLWHSRALASGAPVVVLDGLPPDLAVAAVAELVAAGAVAEVRPGLNGGRPPSRSWLKLFAE
jgi:large subunit ribosomal protein L7/L12